jgi:7-cyano-7-deazaguanine synthase
MSKAYVLLSGGIDSTTCLYLAHTRHEPIEAISIDYGQRHKKEIKHAKMTCQALDIPHRVRDLSSIIPPTMLTDPNVKIPNMSYNDIKGISPTYVPFRNGLILSAITSTVVGDYVKAELQQGTEWTIYFGAHAEDAQNWAYADCTPEWIGAMANAIYIGTYHTIRLATPLEWLAKHDIIKLGEELGVDWSLTWSCYAGGEQHCGACPTCRARKEGFAKAGVSDPTGYAN